ncbi:hypothetical protein QN277_014523 [Acacia crassicarpa]|uniref:Uncharacterized protein n=1 Tax=Acacia crassicarpa TaxID=499986 RepID=A0AAE1MAG4_9FABA|nr:hypothetical protein QN277_014523 [Acacia crassicarpa]
MAKQKNKWNWEASGFNPWKSPTSSSPSSFEQRDQKPTAPVVRRYSISTSSVLQQSKMSKHSSKLHQLGDKVKVTGFHSICAASSSSFSSNQLDEFWFSAFSCVSFSIYSMLVLLMAMYVFLRLGDYQ